jgi:hypothetical protein
MSTIKNIFVLMSLACICINITAHAEDTLQAGFINPPASAKARTWWHWLNGNVSREGITADLEAMQRVGIQEALLFNADMGYPEGSATFLSPEWLELFKFAASEAKRLGLELGFHNGAGWSSSGGPWITPEYAMQTVVYSEVKISCEGGKTLKFQLPQPSTRLNYYRDIMVLAFPKPQSRERIDDLDIKTLSGKLRNHLEPDAKLIPPSALVHKADIIDLTPKMSADGMLEWNAPAGEWIVLRLGHTPTGAENHPAVIGGRGLECDKMNKKAVDIYWKGGISPIIEKLGALVGSTLTSCLIDSYEVGCTNWTAGFNDEFERLRGYDCQLFLPALAGYYVESGEITERFLWDFRRTIGDLIAENYYAYFRELCHKHHLKFATEPYWGPFNSMQVGETGDIVMCEFWSGEMAVFDSPKFVASIAHLNGNPIVGAEAFTSQGGWLNHPATIKQIGDKAWAAGVNRFIIHTYAHQPWNVGPGVTFGNYGFDLNRLNTWWEQGKVYMDYLGRSQFLLQQGLNVADVLVFTGESSPNNALLMPEIKDLGFDYDLIGANKIASLTVKNGLICTPFGRKYRALVLPETIWMTPEMLTKMGILAKEGALIVGVKPRKSPSLQQYPQCDKQVAQLAEALWDAHLIKDRSIVDILKGEDFSPDFSVETEAADNINFIHRVTNDADIYFVANPRKESRQETCHFRVTGKQPELWNAETGEITDFAVWNENGNGTSIPIQFEPEGAVFVVFRKPVSASEHIVETTMAFKSQDIKPLPDLKIIKAEYGTFLPEGLIDVTDAVANSVRKGKLNIHSGTHLASTDPAQGYIKELRIEYETEGQRREVHAIEGEPVNIDAGSAGELKIRTAVYGKFDKRIHGVPSRYPVSNVTEQIADMVSSGILMIPVDDKFDADVSNLGQKKELHIIYSTAGDTHKRYVPEGSILNLAQHASEAKLISKDNKVTWVTPSAGKITYVTSLGKTKTVQVKSVPEPVELTGSWEVNFTPGQGAPENVMFDKLISWSSSPDEGIRYFSGTATYKKQVILSENPVQSGHSLELNLGSVQVIAEVIVNGKNLGILWKAPFKVNLDNFVHEGVNELEVKITNLWPNRLIGDEHLSEDSEWGNGRMEKWPEWLLNNTKRPSKRVTFTTWKHWNKDSPLQPSGLLGPVTICPYIQTKILE